MTISHIKLMRDCGVFYDFSWPSELPEFGQYNLIYGWNGSGKTTLSRIFRALEQRNPITKGRVVIQIDGNDVRDVAFSQATVPVKVFNRDFVNESIFPIGGGDIPPILVIGPENVVKQKEVNRLERELSTAKSSLVATRKKEGEAARALDRFCIDRAKVIKDTLRSPGTNPFNEYDKAAFQREAEKMTEDNSATSQFLNESERETLLIQHKSMPKKKVREVMYSFPSIKQMVNYVSAILATTVVSSVIQSIKEDARLADWTREGLRLHKDRQAEKCLFCEQPIPRGRLAALEAHFSDEYEQFLRRIDEQISQLHESSKIAAQLEIPNRAEFYDDLATDYNLAKQKISQEISAFHNLIVNLIRVLNEKKGQPFKSLKLDIPIPPIDSAVVDKFNKVIREHNQACDDFQTRMSEARKRLALDMIAQGHIEYSHLQSIFHNANGAIEPQEQAVQKLSQEIRQLEREIVEHRQPAEELNSDLKKYLGHDELLLEVEKTGYKIMRHGKPAEGISEGEMTAIALLYFLKSLQDRRFSLEKGVIVLDDPVSSLDANALYYAFGFIREHTSKAKQIFIFTHNFTFFQQVRNWFHYLKGQNKRDISQRPARFYMVDCAHDGSRRRATLSILDPLLERYNSEYHYLFARIYRKVKSFPQCNLDENYVFPNMARRVLEAFLAFRHPHISGELWKKLQLLKFDESKKTRILRFVHTHSHSGAVAEPEHDPSILCEANSVLKDLLDLIQAQDQEHFSAMEKLITPLIDEEDANL